MVMLYVLGGMWDEGVWMEVKGGRGCAKEFAREWVVGVV
jgi:hypothetical protein